MAKSYRDLIAQGVLAASLLPGGASAQTARITTVDPAPEVYCMNVNIKDGQHADHLILSCENRAVPFNTLLRYLEKAKEERGHYPKDLTLRFADDATDVMRTVIDPQKLLELSKAMEKSAFISSEHLAVGYSEKPEIAILKSVRGVVLPTSFIARPTEDIVKDLNSSFERMHKLSTPSGKSIV